MYIPSLTSKKINHIAFLLLIISVSFSNNAVSQSTANNWVFGVGGGLTFDNNTPANAPSNYQSSMNQWEGVATMSDDNGDLLFYTDGASIYDELGNIVNDPNSTSSPHELKGDPSSTQSAIIVPDPADDEQYYIFTVDAFANTDGLQYVIYNPYSEEMTVPILLDGNVTEKLTAVKKGDNSGYYIVSHDWDNDAFLVYMVDCNGLTTLLPQNVGADHNNGTNSTLGYMKFNSDGTKLAIANTYGNTNDGFGFVQVFDFDNLTGVISPNNIVSIGMNNALSATDGSTLFTPYGIEFSPNGQLLYISEVGSGVQIQINQINGLETMSLWQYDLNWSNSSPNTSALQEIGTVQTSNISLTTPLFNYCFGALQVGRDGKIYIAMDERSELGTINIPNNVFTQGNPPLDYSSTSSSSNTFFDLASNTKCKLGLPNFVQSLVIDNGSINVQGESCENTFTYEGTGGVLEWDFGDGSFSNDQSPQHTYNIPGIYTVTLTITGPAGCEITLTEDITVVSCCIFANNNADFVYDNTTNNVISSDLVWDNKVYIADFTVVTVDAQAVLDVTNVDVIFGDCAGIDFTDGSSLRATNSVFRPCQQDGVWRGLNFYSISNELLDSPTAIINECTFKNAQQAINSYSYFNQFREIDLRVTNNLFSNCKAGINLRDIIYTRSITGNTFLIDNLVPAFENFECSWGNPQDYVGINSYRARFLESISQNDFLSPDYTTLNFTGITSNSDRNISISSNNFNNVYQSIELINLRGGSIEMNKIHVTHDFMGYEHQIAVQNSRKILIGNNELINSSQYAIEDFLGNNSAIYCSSGSLYDIKENFIEGFETAIQCQKIRKSHIIDNEISNCHLFGVYLIRPKDVKVSCNTINMEAQNDGNVIGIGYFTDGFSNGNVIQSNCILETNTAMHFEKFAGTTQSLPDIYNNYMYSYSDFGINVIDLNGNIGSSPSVSLGAGRNSFISNNGLGLTADIASTNTLTSYGNSGVNFISNVNIQGNSGSSYASCGQQINYSNSNSSYLEICDDLQNGIVALIINESQLNPDYISAIPTTDYPDLLHALYLLRNNSVEGDADEFYQEVISYSSISVNELNWFRFHNHSLKHEFETALSILNEMLPFNKEEEQLISLQRIHLVAPCDALSSSQITILQSIVESDSRYRDVATNLLFEAGVVSSRFYFPTRQAQNRIVSDVTNLESSSFEVHPNPTNGVISFEYVLEEGIDAELSVIDIAGKTVAEIPLNFQYSMQKMDLNHLLQGVYTLIISSDDVILANSKLIKL